MGLARRAIQKALLTSEKGRALGLQNPDNVATATRGAVVVRVKASKVRSLQKLADFVGEVAQALGMTPVLLDGGKAGGLFHLTFCTRETREQGKRGRQGYRGEGEPTLLATEELRYQMATGEPANPLRVQGDTLVPTTPLPEEAASAGAVAAAEDAAAEA